jgi:DNA-directed RNA polymerase specialized sigma24 family protein
MNTVLNLIAKKHKDWIKIVQTFGCNKDTAEDLVQEMYIKMSLIIAKGTNIMYTDKEINHFYIFRTLRSLFLDLTRKQGKVILIEFDSLNHSLNTEELVDFEESYNKFLNNLDELHWYDKKVYEYIDAGESIAALSEKTKISYYSLYNTYRKVKKILLNKL